MRKKLSHLLLRPYDVFLLDGKPAMVLSPSMDEGSTTRKYSAENIDIKMVNADGTLGASRELHRYDMERMQIQYLDGAEVDIRVKMPEDVVQQLKEYEEQRKEEPKPVYEDDETDVQQYHPSYGAIRLSKISGHTKLFMSPFRHQHFIGIQISRAKRYRSMSADRMHGELRNVVEIFLSEAQFARFITSAYDGGGTPCTIHHIAGTYMPEPPEGDEVDKFHADVDRAGSAAAENLVKALDQAKKLLDKPTVSKQDRKELVSLIEQARRKLDDSMPFIIAQMRERMEKVVADAQTEVESHMNRVIQFLGIKSLTGKEPPIKMLIGGRVKEKEDPKLPDHEEK